MSRIENANFDKPTLENIEASVSKLISFSNDSLFCSRKVTPRTEKKFVSL